MNYRTMAKFIAIALYMEAVFMLQGIAVSLYDEQPDIAMDFVLTITIILIVATILYQFGKNSRRGFYAREGLICVALCWIFMSVLGCLPFVFSGVLPHFVDALFEMVSGFTTTGASALVDVESVPRGLMYWRSFSQWIGGMGVLVFLIAVVKTKGQTAGFSLHLMRAESPGPEVGKLVPQIRESATWLYILYIVLTILCAIFLKLGGMSWYETACIAFETAGTGGFGIKNDGLASYSPYMRNVCTVFMFLFGVNFSLYFLLIRGKIKEVLQDEELRLYIGIVAVATLLISYDILPMFGSISESVHHAAFQVSSIITTTGYASTDFDQWPTFAKSVLILLMATGACAGSTCGGMKCSRVLLLIKTLRRNISQSMFPQKVQVVSVNDRVIDEKVIRNVNSYLAAYVIIIAISFILVSLDGYSVTTSYVSVLSCFNNIGPGLEITGPMNNYATFGTLSKLVLIFDMLAGRLEIFPILAFFMKTTWSRH